MAAWPYNTARWQRLRTRHLGLYPTCEGCEAAGRGPVIANTVDHRKAISDGGAAFPSHDGLASYCSSCHAQKTARGSEAGAVRTTRALQPRKGCDVNGNPLDAAHPWNIPRGHTRSDMQNIPKGNKSLGAAPSGTAVPLPTQLVAPVSCPGGIFEDSSEPVERATLFRAGIEPDRNSHG